MGSTKWRHNCWHELLLGVCSSVRELHSFCNLHVWCSWCAWCSWVKDKFAVVSVFSWHFNVCAKILKDSKTVLEMLQQLEKMRHSGQKWFQFWLLLHLCQLLCEGFLWVETSDRSYFSEEFCSTSGLPLIIGWWQLAHSNTNVATLKSLLCRPCLQLA